MADPGKRKQEATLNRKRRASEDVRPAVQDKRRRTTNPTTAISAASQVLEEKKSKRKRDASPDHEPRKKVMTKHHRLVERTARTYREPEGERKSRRIAGQPAARSGLPLKGRYVEPVVTNESVGLDHVVSRPETSEAQTQQPDVLESRPAAKQSEASDHAQSSSETSGARIQEPDVPDTLHLTQQNEAEHSADDKAEELFKSPQEFLEILAKNVGVHRIICSLATNYNKRIQRSTDLVHAKHGLNDLENQLQSMEQTEDCPQDDLESLRIERATILKQLDLARAQVYALTRTMNDLSGKHSSRNERIYDFTDIRKDSDGLACLPQKFWEAYNRCDSSHSACEGIAQEVRRLEAEQLDVLHQLDEQIEASIKRSDGHTARLPSDTAPGCALSALAEQTRDLSNTSRNLDQLEMELNTAKDKQYDQESKLHRIAEIALVAAGLISSLSGIEDVELHRRFPDVHEPGTQREAKESDPLRSSRRDPPQHPGNDDMRRTTAALRQAKEKLGRCRRRLDDIRSGPFSDASSLDSESRGEARVRKMIERTGALRDAENNYKSVLYRAQDDGAISERDQESNFRDHESDGYPESGHSRYMKHPDGKAMKSRVNRWAESVGESEGRHQIMKDPAVEDKEGSWVSRVSSMDLGEDWTERAPSRKSRLIDQQKELCENLRATGPFERAENDFHPKNDPTRSNGEGIDESDHRIPAQPSGDESLVPRSRKRPRAPSDELTTLGGHGSPSEMSGHKRMRTAMSL